MSKAERWLFASDVHLTPAAPARSALFHRFLDEQASRATRLYLLGDVFDFYIGPRHARLPDYRETIGRLADLQRAGVALELLHGNRDFLAGTELPFDCVRAEDFVITAGGQRLLLAHGDLFCTRDHSYARARRVLRSRPVRFLATRAPQRLVLGAARALRGYSRKVVREKGATITDLVVDAVTDAFRRHGVDTIVAGHVHRLRDLTGSVDGRACRFLGLGAWHEEGSYVELTGGRLSMRTFA